MRLTTFSGSMNTNDLRILNTRTGGIVQRSDSWAVMGGEFDPMQGWYTDAKKKVKKVAKAVVRKPINLVKDTKNVTTSVVKQVGRGNFLKAGKIVVRSQVNNVKNVTDQVGGDFIKRKIMKAMEPKARDFLAKKMMEAGASGMEKPEFRNQVMAGATAIGGAIGALVGSVIPGAGTAVGAGVGAGGFPVVVSLVWAGVRGKVLREIKSLNAKKSKQAKSQTQVKPVAKLPMKSSWLGVKRSVINSKNAQLAEKRADATAQAEQGKKFSPVMLAPLALFLL
jgi:hypothetical protein